METNERIEFAKQNGMSLAFVNWFFDEKKEQCGLAWSRHAAIMWEGWKAGEAHNNKAVLRSMGIK